MMIEPTSPLLQRLEATTLRLTARSVSANPHAGFVWPTTPAPDRLAMSPALLSIGGHPLYCEFTDAQRWRFALLETVNFFSLNIAGERDLMRGLKSRLTGDIPVYVLRYLQHFLHEEAAHTVVFTRFCLNYGGLIFRDRQVKFPRQFLPGEEDFVFFAQALIFEEIADFYNRKLASDASLWTLARDINRYHAEEEARHIAFGRLYVNEMWERCGGRWTPEDKRRIAGYLHRYIRTVQRSYVNVDVYRSCGLPAEVREEILQSPHWISIAEQSAREVTRWLRMIGLGE